MNQFAKCFPVALYFLSMQPIAVAQIISDTRMSALPAPGLLGTASGVIDAPGREPGKLYRNVTKARTVLYTTTEEVPEEEKRRLDTFREAVQAMRKKHESSEEKEKTRTALETLVIEQMNRDLETREEQLAEIEAQAKQLREQLEQRRAAKPEFVKLIMMMIENPAAGIGLPSEWMNSIGPSLQPAVAGAVPTHYSGTVNYGEVLAPPQIDSGIPNLPGTGQPVHPPKQRY